jgi:hypothetical protein
MKLKLKHISVLLMLTFAHAFGSTAVLLAQTGQIVGRVTDENGSPLRYANVVIVGTKHGAMTLKNGSYFIHAVPAGRYSVRVMNYGYSPTEKPDITVKLGDMIELDFKLKKALSDSTIVSEPVYLGTLEDKTGRFDRTGKSATISADQLESGERYPDTLPTVTALGLEFQSRFILTQDADSTVVNIVLTGENTGNQTIDLCGVFSFLILRYRIGSERLPNRNLNDRNERFFGTTLRVGIGQNVTPLLVCTELAINPGEAISDTLRFSYRTEHFKRVTGDVRFWCLFFHGEDGAHWEDTEFIDIGVMDVPIGSSI